MAECKISYVEIEPDLAVSAGLKNNMFREGGKTKGRASQY